MKRSLCLTLSLTLCWFAALLLARPATSQQAAEAAPSFGAEPLPAQRTSVDGVDFQREIAEERLFLVRGERAPGEYVVAFHEGFEPGRLAGDLSRDVGVERGRVWGEQPGGVFRGMLARGVTARKLKVLLAQPGVRYVEENAVLHAAASPQADPPWGLDRIDQRHPSLSDDYTYDYDGTGVNAYILDSGIRPTHDDFGGRASVAYDAIGDGQAGIDCNGHGTHVAGIVGGETYGVAKDANLLAIRVIGCNGSALLADILDGIDWMVMNHSSPAVAVMAFTGGPTSTLDDAVAAAFDAGIFVAAPAGNNNDDACFYSPGREPKAFTVSAMTYQEDRRSFGANLGWCVDLFAPGQKILSAWHTGDGDSQERDGTSQAAAHAAGAAALVLEELPASTPADIAAELIDRATEGDHFTLGPQSPPLLLYTLNAENPLPAPPELMKDTLVTGLSGDFEDQLRFQVEVPAGATRLLIINNEGAERIDLWVTKDGLAAEASEADCAVMSTNYCSFPTPDPGTYYIQLVAAEPFGFSGATLIADWATDDNVLTSGVPTTDLWGSGNAEFLFTFEAPADTGQLLFEVPVEVGDGRVELYVNFGSPATTSEYDCRDITPNAYLSCELPSQEGTWYVLIRGAGFFQRRSVVATFFGNVLSEGVPITGLDGTSGTEFDFTFEVADPGGLLTFRVPDAVGTGDVDLYVRLGAQATPMDFDCFAGPGPEQICEFAPAAAGTYHVLVRGNEAFMDRSIVAEYIDGVFNDDFESGNTSAWPTVQDGSLVP